MVIYAQAYIGRYVCYYSTLWVSSLPNPEIMDKARTVVPDSDRFASKVYFGINYYCIKFS
jgi:hypothetical protein